MGLAIIGCFYGSLYAESKKEPNKSLSAKQQGIIPIAAYTANGDLQQLKLALNEGLEAGLTVNEIKEIIVHYRKCPRIKQNISFEDEERSFHLIFSNKS